MTVYPGESQTALRLRQEIHRRHSHGRGHGRELGSRSGRLANLPEYRNLPQCEKLVKEIADELKVKSPLHPD
jgi:predicted transposase YdaD